MATHTSTVPDVLDALKALLDARKVAAPNGPMKGVEVRTAPTGDPVPKEVIAFLGTNGDQAWGAIGNRRRKETYTLRTGIFILRGGAGEEKAVEVRNRAYEVQAEIEDAIRVMPTIGLADRVIIQLVRSDLTQDWQDNGRVAALDIDLAVTAELVST